MKTRLPYSRFCYSTLGNVYKMQCHVFGVMAFGKAVYVFVDLMEYPHDANLHMSCLLYVLSQLKDHMPRDMHVQVRCPCPPTTLHCNSLRHWQNFSWTIR